MQYSEGKLDSEHVCYTPEGRLSVEDRWMCCGCVRLRFGINEWRHIVVRVPSVVVFDIDPCSSRDEAWFDELVLRHCSIYIVWRSRQLGFHQTDFAHLSLPCPCHYVWRHHIGPISIVPIRRVLSCAFVDQLQRLLIGGGMSMETQRCRILPLCYIVPSALNLYCLC